MSATTQPTTQSHAPPRAWVDLASPSHPFLFAALLRDLDVIPEVTVRQKTETVTLAETIGLDPTILGRDFDNPTLRKFGIPLRTLQLSVYAPPADVSLSSRNAMCILASKARGIPSIHFTDNDITAYVDGLHFEELYNRLEAMATHSIVPAAFETRELTKHGAPPESIHTYDGYKEDIYVADFTPDPRFTDRLPFEEFIVVRPEALDAAYVDEELSIAPEIVSLAVDAGLNVVYLPRGRGDDLSSEYPDDRVFVPEAALDGLQLAWHGQAVLTGSGTMAREAACMDKPAVSFFPNERLSVDRELIEEGKMFHSRSPAEIVEFVSSRSGSDLEADRSRSRAVKAEVIETLEDLMTRYSGPT